MFGPVDMEAKHTEQELEVARILEVLPELLWEADHCPPCTHKLRWGTRKKRSAGNEEPQTPLPPPPARRPVAAPSRNVEKPNGKRTKNQNRAAIVVIVESTEEVAAAATPTLSPSLSPPPPPPVASPSRKVEKPKRTRTREQKKPAAAAAAVVMELEPIKEAAAAATTSPDTPLSFCPSGGDADTKPKVYPPNARPSTLKEELIKDLVQANNTRIKLEKEVAEIRNRQEAERAKNSRLRELRIKLKEEKRRDNLQQQQTQLPPVDPIRYIPATHHQQWGTHHPTVHSVGPVFSIDPPPPTDHRTPTAGAGNHRQFQPSWVSHQLCGLDGHYGGARLSQIPDLNCRDDEGFGLEFRRQQQDAKREAMSLARRKRIEIYRRKSSAAAARAALKHQS